VIQNTGKAVWESGIYIFNLRGTSAASNDSTISNCNIHDTGQFNIFVQNNGSTNANNGSTNYAGVNPNNMDLLTLSSDTFSNSGVSVIGDHVSVFGTNNGAAASNLRTVVTSSTFTAHIGTGVGADYAGTHTSDNIQVDASGTGHSDFDISSSSFSGAGQSAINVSGAGTGFATFNVHNNTLVTVRAGVGINVAGNGSATMRGFVQNNPHIYSTVSNNPASGIQVFSELSGLTVVTLNNNVIERDPGNAANGFQTGIRGYARGTGELDLTVSNNSVLTASGNGFEGFTLDAGNATAGENNTVKVNLVSNTIDGSNGASDYLFTQYSPNTFQIQGLTGSGANATNVNNFIAATDADPSPTDPTVDCQGGLVVNYTAGSPSLAQGFVPRDAEPVGFRSLTAMLKTDS